MLRPLCFWVGKDEAPRVLVEYDVSDADFACMPEKATYKEVKDWIYENYSGMTVSSLYIGQVKKKLGLPKERDGNKSGRKNHQPQVTAEKEAAIIAAFKHFRMM